MIPSKAILIIASHALADAVRTGADKSPDFFEAMAVTLGFHCSSEAMVAERTAALMREAERAQLTFTNLLQEGAK